MTSMTETPRDVFDENGRGLQHQGLRRTNERAVLTVIGFNNGVSNADIARVSGLAPQTVSAILIDLDGMGLIRRGEVLRGRRGQPATPIYLRAEGAYAVGIEIGWRHVDVLLLNFHAEVMARQRRDYSFPDVATIVADVSAMVAQVRQAIGPNEQDKVVGLGIAMPSTLVEDMHLLPVPAAQQKSWRELDLTAELELATGLQVTLFNDGNAACWAELIAFPRPRPGNFIYLMVSHYIAAGIVGEGMLWEGPTNNSANLGAMLVSNGAGEYQSAHRIASIPALLNRLEAAGHEVNLADMQHWDWDSFGTVLDDWISASATALAQVAYNTVTVIESQMLVIDGVMPDAITQRLVDAVDRQIQAMPIPPHLPIEVMRGHLGAMAPAIGAAELPMFRRYLSRALVDLPA